MQGVGVRRVQARPAGGLDGVRRTGAVLDRLEPRRPVVERAEVLCRVYLASVSAEQREHGAQGEEQRTCGHGVSRAAGPAAVKNGSDGES